MEKSRESNVGQIRPSALMFSFGIGAIIDLPYLSVIVTGLDDWKIDPSVAPRVSEDRLLRAVQWQLGGQVVQLVSPPASPSTLGPVDPFSPANFIGVPVATFPRWMRCPKCQRLAPLSSGLFTLDYKPNRPEQARYVHSNCSRGGQPAVVPARFLVACENGHLDDFPWVDFVHQGNPCPAPLLSLIEYGVGGEARDLQVRCDNCHATRSMADAFGERGKFALPICRGRRPHLRDFDEEGCTLQARALLLGASNLWFPIIVSSLSIPSATTQLDQRVEQQWATLQNLQSIQNVQLLRNIGQLGDFVGYSDNEIWQAIERRRNASTDGASDPTDLKTPEWEVLSNPNSLMSNDELRLREVSVPAGFGELLERVVLVERMREVRALVGFTRIAAPGDQEEDPQPRVGQPMGLARQLPTWVPATDVRGEGIFIQFRESAIQAWLGRAEIGAFSQQFLAAHCRWREVRGILPVEDGYPGMRFVLLHSFTHALMRQLTLECGYAAASVRERLFSRNPNQLAERPDPMAGILIYTAAPDSEGTLGGLVALGEPEELGRLIRAALRDAQLCASDPLCAEHPPSIDGLTLHAATCHACMFAPETSCERGNRYLDRSVLVPTVEHTTRAFFSENI